jgi:hypothetical protein
MMDFLLKQNDVAIVNGDIAICENSNKAIAQAISLRLKTISSEWFLDASVGLPYFTDVFGQKRSERYLQQLVTTEIGKVPGIKQLNDVSVQIDAHRTVHIKFTASLSDGTSFNINEYIGRI